MITTVYGVSKLQHKNSIHSIYFTTRTTYSNTCYFIICMGKKQKAALSVFSGIFFPIPAAVPKSASEKSSVKDLCLRTMQKTPENVYSACKKQHIMFKPVISCLFLKTKRLNLHILQYKKGKQLTMASYSLLNSI